MPDVIVRAEGKRMKRVDYGSHTACGVLKSSEKVEKLAKEWGIWDASWLYRCIHDAKAGVYSVPEKPKVEEKIEEPPPPDVDPLSIPVWVRGLKQRDDEKGRTTYTDLPLCLGDMAIDKPEPLIEWDYKMEDLCAVDVDFHTLPMVNRPTDAALQKYIDRMKPVPHFAWITHGRGLRFIYYGRGGFPAFELAAVAACWMKALEQRATCELKHSTRHPGYPNARGAVGGVVRALARPDVDVSAVMGWREGRGSVDRQKVDQYLEDNYDGQKSIGRRYPHHKCPVDPLVDSHGDPVVVYEDGIMCWGCNGHGVRRGVRAAGWFPFETLLGAPCASQISICVDSFTHWEHAKFVLAGAHAIDESILRGAYGALLRSRHRNDPRIGTVFAAGTDVVRFDKRWGTLRGESYSNTHLDAILAKLPAAQYEDKGKVKPDPEKIARFLQATSLQRLGYPELRIVWGCKVGSHFVPARYPYEIVVQPHEGRLPRYVRREERDLARAWGKIETAFPGVNRAAVELFVAAKGCFERDSTWPPFVFVSGPTRSAKSTTATLAAAIAGDRVSEVTIIGDEEKLRAAIATAKEKGSYCVFNEAVKSQGRRKGVTKDESMEFALALTRDSSSWKLYVGHVPLGTPPVCIWTDVLVPPGMKQNAQVARRFVWVHIPDTLKKDWTDTCLREGIERAEWLRRAPDEGFNRAADVILSDVIDRYFKDPMPFNQIAADLGFVTLDKSAEADEQRRTLQHFYELVRNSHSDLKHEEGFLVLDPHGRTEVEQLWFELADDDPKKLTSQRIAEQDWTLILGAPWRVQCEVRSRRTRILVRFTGVLDDNLLRYREPKRDRSQDGGGQAIHSALFDAADVSGDSISNSQRDTKMVGVGAEMPVEVIGSNSGGTAEGASQQLVIRDDDAWLANGATESG